MQCQLQEIDRIRQETKNKQKAANKAAMTNERATTKTIQGERVWAKERIVAANLKHKKALVKERRDVDTVVAAKNSEISLLRKIINGNQIQAAANTKTTTNKLFTTQVEARVVQKILPGRSN